jgi:hypothetical protein
MRASPIPFSARTHKSAPGFEQPDRVIFADGERLLRPRGVKDWLFRDESESFDPDWVPMEGWYLGSETSRESCSVNMLLRTHADRSMPQGVTREGRLFVRQNIGSGQKFVGSIRSFSQRGDELLDELRQQMISSRPMELFIGRQPGRIEIQRVEEISDGSLPWQPTPCFNPIDRRLVSVTLLSDALVVDPYLRPLPFFPSHEIAKAVSVRKDKVKGPIRHFSRCRPLSGWNKAYSRFREWESVIVAGSVFLYQIEWDAGFSDQKVVECLDHMQKLGLGLRTTEGFGEIRVNDPFHLTPATVGSSSHE